MQLFLPRVIVMYLIAGAAFLFYVTKIPERYFPGESSPCVSFSPHKPGRLTFCLHPDTHVPAKCCVTVMKKRHLAMRVHFPAGWARALFPTSPPRRGLSSQVSWTTWAPATRCGTFWWWWCFTGGIRPPCTSCISGTAVRARRGPSAEAKTSRSHQNTEHSARNQ